MSKGRSMNIFEITLDVDKRANKESVNLRQGDASGTTIRATLMDHDVPMEGGSYTAMFCMTLPDRKTFYRDDATYENGVVSVVVNEQYAAQVPGITNNAYFELYDGEELKYTTASFVVRIKPSASDGKAAHSYDPRVESLMAEMRELIEDVTLAEEERAAAEQGRAETFAESEQGRSSAFDDGESGRQQAFESSEDERQTAFESSEASRALTFSASETSRQQTFASSEQSRENTFVSNERRRQEFIDRMPTSYVSQESFDFFCAELGGVLGLRITKVWNTATSQYEYVIVSQA